MKIFSKALLLALFAALIMVSCSDDDDTTGEEMTKGNKNINNFLNETTNLSSTQEALQIAQRIEMPALKGGNNWFLVYKSNDIGVNICIEWDTEKRAQRWTAYQMTATTNTRRWNRNNWVNQIFNNKWANLCYEQTGHSYADPYQPDPSLPNQYRTELDDYRGSGYNRGHICPSADRLSSMTANEQTFYLSNMQPQLYEFNVGTWEDMENKVRQWSPSSGSTDTMYVCKGGTIDNGLAGYARNLLVPKYFFMAILVKNHKNGNGGYKAMAFWIEHKGTDQGSNLSKFAMSIDELEAKTGIDFFCNLPDDIESQVESNYVPSVWGLK